MVAENAQTSHQGRSKVVQGGVATAIGAVRENLTALDHDSSPYSDPEIAAFLRQVKTPAKAATSMIAAATWRAEHPAPTIADIAPFLRNSPGLDQPEGCCVVMEDCKGGVARDNIGRPVVVCVGMMHGSADEMQMQMHYVQQRLAHFRLPDQAPGESCTIIEIHPRNAGSKPTFRFPDASIRSLFDLGQQVFPGSQLTTTHFCGLPRAVTFAFRLCKPFMSADAYNNMKLKPGFSHLKDKYVPSSSLLPSWDPAGTNPFDIDEYIEWRAAEEGVEVCGKGEGRPFATTGSDEDAINGAGVGRLSTSDLFEDEEAKSQLIKHGSIQKRGSGRGMFGNRRWKDKLVVLRPGGMLYFDTDEVSPTNLASRLILLDPSCTVERTPLEGMGFVGPSATILVTTTARDFIFGFSSDAEADEWVEAVRAAVVEPVAGGPGAADATAAALGDEAMAEGIASLSLTTQDANPAPADQLAAVVSQAPTSQHMPARRPSISPQHGAKVGAL